MFPLLVLLLRYRVQMSCSTGKIPKTRHGGALIEAAGCAGLGEIDSEIEKTANART